MKKALLASSLILSGCQPEPSTPPPDTEALRLEAAKANAQRIANCNGKSSIDLSLVPIFLREEGVKIISTSYLPGDKVHYDNRLEDYLPHLLKNDGFNLLEKVGPIPQVNAEHGATIGIALERNRALYLILLFRTHFEDIFVEYGRDQNGDIMSAESSGDIKTYYRIYVDKNIDGTLDGHGSISIENGKNLTPAAFFDAFTSSDERDYQRMLLPEKGLCVDKK